jgi:hypothetical protein
MANPTDVDSDAARNGEYLYQIGVLIDVGRPHAEVSFGMMCRMRVLSVDQHSEMSLSAGRAPRSSSGTSRPTACSLSCRRRRPAVPR